MSWAEAIHWEGLCGICRFNGHLGTPDKLLFTNEKESVATWLLVCSPVLLLLVFIALALHVRVRLGHWPTPMIESYHTPAYYAHEQVLTWVGLFTVYAAIPLWLLMLCVRPLRVSLRTHLIQAGVYVAGWILIALYGAVDPGRFMEWFLD